MIASYPMPMGEYPSRGRWQKIILDDGARACGKFTKEKMIAEQFWSAAAGHRFGLCMVRRVSTDQSKAMSSHRKGKTHAAVAGRRTSAWSGAGRGVSHHLQACSRARSPGPHR